jgi:hypothetical protein
LTVFSAYIDTKINPIKGVFTTLIGKSYHLTRFYNQSISEQLSQLIAKHNPQHIIYDSLFSTVYFDDLSQLTSVKHIYREHNIEHIIWQNLAYETSGWKKNAYIALSETLRMAETKMFKKLRNILAINTQDLGLCKNNGFCGKIQLHYPSFDIPDKLPPMPAMPLSFYQLASMDWKPNAEGVQWFISEAFPVINQVLNQEKVTLAGKGMSKEFIKKSKHQLEVLGEVEDSKIFISDKHILIVPLFSGSGIRIKIPEAMAAGKLVISTSKGAEGLGLQHNENIIIADTAEQWAEAFRYVIENPEKVEKIRQNAFFWVKENFSSQALSRSLVDFLNSAI